LKDIGEEDEEDEEDEEESPVPRSLIDSCMDGEGQKCVGSQSSTATATRGSHEP
jgi:hypothetical protein